MGLMELGSNMSMIDGHKLELDHMMERCMMELSMMERCMMGLNMMERCMMVIYHILHMMILLQFRRQFSSRFLYIFCWSRLVQVLHN